MGKKKGGRRKSNASQPAQPKGGAKATSEAKAEPVNESVETSVTAAPPSEFVFSMDSQWKRCTVSADSQSISAKLLSETETEMHFVFKELPVPLFHIQAVERAIPDRPHAMKAVFPADSTQ